MNSLGAKALFDVAVALLDPRVLAARGWTIHSKTFPVLDLSFQDRARQELRLRLECDDWNDSPPSVSLLAPHGSILAGLPTLRPGNNIFNGSAHPRTGRPFVCITGVREYHDYPSHRADVWGNYKASDNYTLGNIVDKLWNGWWRVWP